MLVSHNVVFIHFNEVSVTNLPMMRPFLLALIYLISVGCREHNQATSEADAPARSSRAPVKLTISVVDDVEMAAEIKLLSGEWSERSGGELEIEIVSLEELLAKELLKTDVVIYSSRQLGTLVSRKWLRPIRQSVLENPELAYSDLLPVVRDQMIRYGGEVWAMPLGEMPLVLAWRGEVPANLPKTWGQLAESPLARQANSSEAAVDYPLAAEFIARVVAATPPMDRAALFFDPETMDADLSQPQMLRALAQIRSVPGDTAVDTSFSCEVTLPPHEEQIADQWTPLLTARETFNASLDRWEKLTTSETLVVCGFSGRLVSVTQASRNAASAFKLLPWLVSGNTGARLSQRSKATLWFRNSQVSQAAKWLPAQSAAENAGWLTRLLSQRDAYLIPRLPGIENYLAALNETLASKPVPETLSNVEHVWNAITDAHGREQQREAFRGHLGLPD